MTIRSIAARTGVVAVPLARWVQRNGFLAIVASAIVFWAISLFALITFLFQH